MTNIVFYYINKEVPDYAECCMQSIKRFMPDSMITMLTDKDTPEIAGVDRVIRKDPEHPIERDSINYIGYQYLSDMDINPSVFIDPDMLFNGSIEDIIPGDYDVAVATRAFGDPVPVEYLIEFPWCSFMVVKNPQFWKDCYKFMLGYSKADWTDNMAAVKAMIKSGKYRVKILDGNIYNVMPLEYRDGVKVYHFKVTDKSGMRPFWEQYCKGGIQ